MADGAEDFSLELTIFVLLFEPDGREDLRARPSSMQSEPWLGPVAS